MLRKIYLSIVSFLVFGFAALAQNNTGAIKVTLKDKGNNEAIPFANVVVYQNGVQVGVGTTNIDGEAVVKPLPPGKYDVKGVYVGYQPAQMSGVLVGEGKTAYVNLLLSGGIDLGPVDIVAYVVPLVDPDTKSGATVTREDYQNMATKDINSVAATTAGVFQADEGGALNIRGGRNSGTVYFVDGVKIIGGSGLPQQAIEQINVITGGLPAMYGDANSGVVSITTRGPMAKYFGNIELISSQLTDRYGYNSIGFAVGGPIITKRDTNGNKVPIVGFMLSGQGNYEKDPIPSALQLYKIKDSKLAEIQETPLIASQSGSGFNRSLEYITKDDLTPIKSHQNIARRSIALNGKLDIKAAANTNITIGGALDYSNAHSFVYTYQLFNAENNPQSISNTWRAYARVTQKFGNQTTSTTDKEKSQSLINNAFFSFLASYDKTGSRTFDDTHKDKIFNYGYIGKFNRKFTEKENIYNYSLVDNFMVNGQNVGKAYEYRSRSEYEVTFEPGDLNPGGTRYTEYMFDLFGGSIPFFDIIPALQGLVNGSNPQPIYSMWNAFGNQANSYARNYTSQIRFASSFNVDIKDHALTVGVEYDQRDQRYHAVAPIQLWSRMRALANKHTTDLDKSNPILVPELSGTYPAYYYENKYVESEQSVFSVNLLQKLGMPINNTRFVNIDELDPSTFDLKMFSAEDLLGQNSGNQLVAYFGYDHHGNRTKEQTNINDFLNKRDAYGKQMFPQGSFRPIYMSAYVQDKFDFKDIKFNVGLRIDRYDANQKTLKDKYSLFQLETVGETKDRISHPGNMGDDYAIYITDDPNAYNAGDKSYSPTIVGYRNEDRWFDSNGNEVSDPTLLAGQAGKLTPYLKDWKSGERMSVEAFTNYKAQINVMPRLAFSFPISDVANFFAHYDVLTRRPGGNRFDPLSYYFMSSESSTPFLANPSLKPEQTVDYELGFTQVLNERKNAALKISTYYREFRNLLTQKQITGAYPKTYLTYVNQDFGTSKGFSVEFDLRRTGGSRLTANYTLGFADGTGSNANSGANLAASGQPNLRILLPLDYDQRHQVSVNYDYRFGSGKDYKGPEWKRKEGNPRQILKDVGFNLQMFVGSGTPYTRWAYPTASNSAVRTSILGSVNGSYKPWNFRSNLRIDKNIELTWGKKDADKRKSANLNIYLQVLNLLNNRNVLGVYSFTGNPDDDGYLVSTQGASTLKSAVNQQSFIDLYNIYINNPGNYSRPRVIRIGLLLDF